MWDRRAEYLENHDGDTVKMVIDQGFGDTKLMEIRLFGVFAPELKQVGGPECQDFVKYWLESRVTAGRRWNFVVTTTRMKVADREQKTLDRYVGVITSLDGTDNLNLEIMNYIKSKGYAGGTGS